MIPGLLTIGSGPTAVRIQPPLFLAPMEGITDPCFRTLVTRLGGVGGASTEFLRISANALPARVIRRNLGGGEPCPVAVQLMAAEPEHVPATVAAAEAAGAAWIDLNFGCPAPMVFRKCAGSALLAHPQRMAAIVAAALSATRLPVSAKLRAGIGDAAQVGPLVRGLADAGAAMITLHARLRVQSYATPPTWSWIAEARSALAAGGHRIPLVGNGGVEHPAQVAAMIAATGCDGVMIGRGALHNPWIFREALGGAPAGRAEALAFVRAYADAVAQARSPQLALIKLKQLARYCRAGGIIDDGCRAQLLRLDDLAAALALLGAAAPVAAPAA